MFFTKLNLTGKNKRNEDFFYCEKKMSGNGPI